MHVKGQFSEAEVFTDVLEQKALDQITNLCNQKFTKNSKIRIMPDVHAGAGCTIGTTMTIDDFVVPNLVGVDIACGMETVKIANKKINLEKLDQLIYKEIPSGFKVRTSAHDFSRNIDLSRLRCNEKTMLDLPRAYKSIGSLGGGNHFIEADIDENQEIYIVIHSGSRNIGNQVAKYYQDLAIKNMTKEMKGDFDKSLAHLSGDDMEDYLHDMKIIEKYADLNRKAQMDIIVNGMGLEIVERFTTIHNFIDTEKMILRKGAVSAEDGEKLIIPLNMQVGSLICVGKGNANWNFSAPHGAGRTLSRTAAKSKLSMHEFSKSMKGIYSSSVGKSTLDESPMAYKKKADIVKYIHDTVDIISHIKPIYNFKA